MKKTVVTVNFMALLLSACSTMSGPQPIITADGVPVRKSKDKPDSPALSASLAARFTENAKAAASTGGKENIDAMLDSGFALIHADCHAFFRQAGHSQNTARVLRDSVAPVAALLSGVLALYDFEDHPKRKQNLLQIITLGTATSTSAIDIYENNFLFGKDNIDSVRKMTIDALGVHRTAVLAKPPSTFGGAVVQIMDNQVICQPSQILARVQAVIKSAKFEPKDSTANVPEAGPPAVIPPVLPPVVPPVVAPGGVPPPPPPPPPPATNSSGFGTINVEVAN